MVALNRFTMSDLARQKRVEVDLDGGVLSRAHSVAQAVEHYRDRMQIRDAGLRWTAFSRGVMLDGKRRLGELEVTDTEWTVMPEVSAG
ncbi:MAG: hypothetical protein JW829_07900 [Pirellulales bacterium]|nr:hypothetical protein [Pirellulales bacterium]